MLRAVVIALLATAAAAAQVKSKTTHPKQDAPATTTHKPAVASTKHAAARPPAKGRTVRARAKGRSHAHVAAAPSYQLHPDAERYSQIQQALAERGYFKGQPDGTWNDESTDALKRFQADQKLEPDGKINALSLTGLGLGPKHDGTSAASVPLSAANPSGAENPDPFFPSELPSPPPPPPDEPQ